jgi:CheY-like chemotaxis protein
MASPTILYVEDHPSVRHAVLMSLQMVGFGVLGADDGVEGVEMAQKHHPDLVLMDLHLPRMDGWEALAALRGDPVTAGIPVIACTAGDLDPDRARAAGFADFIAKPFQAPRLIAAIRAQLPGDGGLSAGG